MKLRPQALTQAVVVLVAVLAAGCGSGSSASPPTTVSRNLGCSLLSDQQLKGLLGDHITVQAHGASDCYYVIKPGTYLLVSATSTSNAVAALNSLVNQYGDDPGSSEVQVAGQRTLWVPAPAGAGGGGKILGVSGGDLVVLTMTAGGPDPEATAVRALNAILDTRNGR